MWAVAARLCFRRGLCVVAHTVSEGVSAEVPLIVGQAARSKIGYCAVLLASCIGVFATVSLPVVVAVPWWAVFFHQA